MLANLSPEEVRNTFGLLGVVYYAEPAGSGLHVDTADFLARIGLPDNSMFSPKADIDDVERSMKMLPSLKEVFGADGPDCPPESEGWEVLGRFVYALVAIDPQDGRVYAFPEGEEFYVPLHADVSSFVHSLIVLEQGGYKGIPNDEEYRSRAAVVNRMQERIVAVDPTPFGTAESEWVRIFEEITMGMWG
ncbi:SUKH-4 family immunity protein [Streptomyces sp. NPDC023998]|uniref:SUKH-4 family immunity protein n=1 Tax=Streptomyces sp. NPDC023998 TaxID=3154597 RepID=UPI0033E2537F